MSKNFFGDRSWVGLVVMLAMPACDRTERPFGSAKPAAAVEEYRGQKPTGSTNAAIQPFTVNKATVDLAPTEGQKAQGRLALATAGGRVHITGQISGLARRGQHGFHIHQNGDCRDNGEAAGPHFGPRGNPHGAPGGGASAHHAGDLGNVTAGDGGVASVDIWSDLPMLTKGEQFVVGRSFVVHADPDDLRTQPGGGSGARLACGVIEPANR